MNVKNFMKKYRCYCYFIILTLELWYEIVAVNQILFSLKTYVYILNKRPKFHITIPMYFSEIGKKLLDYFFDSPGIKEIVKQW